MPKDTYQTDTLRVSLGQFSSAGRKSQNQDFHGAVIPTGPALTHKGITAAVADGISTSPVSAEAAETAVKSLLTDYYATPESWTVKTAASQVISAANAWLHRHGNGTDLNTGRVCTLSALILKGRSGHILHVGDSRITRISDAGVEPLTKDHRITVSVEESYLGRALGMEERVEIDYHSFPLHLGEFYLLTTDGVHEHVDARTLRELLQDTDLDEAARRIADTALAAGSDDNLTVQVLRIDAVPDPDTTITPEVASLPIPPLPADGDMLDGYRILRPMQSTARSHVFLASGPTGERVVLKIPASDTGADPGYLRRFALEEWIARRITSPHVLRAAPPSSATRSSLYVATEYVDGVTLRQWMADHPNPDPDLNTVRDIIKQTVAGLRALHRREMIHQDLRPENVMIDHDGTVKIIDLGSTSVAGIEEAAPGTLPPQPGTYQYTAPEYFSGDVVSWRSDQFSLGVMAYEMLTGRLPYGPDVSRIRSRRDQMRLSYRPARDDDSPVPVWMDAALKRATHPDPLQRYDALSEFLADLKQPGATWKAGRHVPLAERNPVRFWQGVSLILALICITLAVRLGG